MGLASIEGFLLESEQLNAEWGKVGLNVSLLIKMDSPLENVIDVQAALPAFDYGVTAEPTFTIGLSYYPGRTDLLLRTAPSVREHPAGRPWWLVDLQYEASDWLNQHLVGEDQGKGKVGKKKKLKDSTDPAAPPGAQEVITNPWDEPPNWSSSSRTVTTTRWHDAQGNLLTHTNGLPLTEGIQVPLQLEVHTFTWNVEYDTFDYDTVVKPFIGKVASGLVGRLKSAQEYHALCETITCTENERTYNLAVPSGQTGGQGTHHYVTLNATFVIDRRTYGPNVPAAYQFGYFREAHRRVSMHTMQFADPALFGYIGLVPIPINDRGDLAQSPWPLDANGEAIPYTSLNNPTLSPPLNPITDFGWIDVGMPETADLAQFCIDHNLEIP